MKVQWPQWIQTVNGHARTFKLNFRHSMGFMWFLQVNFRI